MMKKRIISLMLAAFSALALCTSAFAAEAKIFKHWNVYMENGAIFGSGSAVADAGTTAPAYRPAWLPEGWTLDSASVMGKAFPVTDWVYSNGEESLSFQCCAPFTFFFSHWMGEDFGVATPKKSVKIQGHPAIFWQVKQESALAWEDSQGKLFLLLHTGSLTQAELEKIANSIVELTEPMPEYHLGWAPEQSGMLPSTAMPGYMRDTGKGPDYIRFFYATQPLTAPKGTPETVTVQGVQAQLWLGDPNAAGVVVTSAISGETAEIPTSDTWSTLLWTDPETGICFCIQGHKLAKETMLRMAESVVQTVPSVQQLQEETPAAVNPPAGPNTEWEKKLAEAKKIAYQDLEKASPEMRTKILEARKRIINSTSWAADGYTAYIIDADGKKTPLPRFFDLFPGWELPGA